MSSGSSIALRGLRLLGWWLLIGYFVGGLAYLALRYYVWPRVDDWRPQIVARLSAELGREVSIERVSTGFVGWQPSLRLEGIALRDAEGQVQLSARSADARLSLRRLLSGHPELSVLELEAPRLTVEHLGARQWRVAGFDMHPETHPEGARDGRGWSLLLAQRLVRIHDGRVDFFDRVDETRQSLQGIELVAERQGLHYQAALSLPQAGLARRLRAALRFDRPLLAEADDWRQWTGELFVGAEGVDGPAVAALNRSVFLRMMPIPVAAEVPAGGAGTEEMETDDSAGERPAVAALAGLKVRDGDFLLWSRFAEGLPVDSLLKLATRRMSWQTPWGQGRFQGLEAELQARTRPGGGYRLDIGRARIELDDHAGLSLQGQPHLELDAGGRLISADLALAPLDLSPVTGWARAQAWSRTVGEGLERLRPEGRIDALSLQAGPRDAAADGAVKEASRGPAQGPTQGAAEMSTEGALKGPVEGAIKGAVEGPVEGADWRLVADFAGLNLPRPGVRVEPDAEGHIHPALPGFENLKGRLELTAEGGRLALGLGAAAPAAAGASPGALWFPGVFDEPRVPLDSLEARVSWRREPASAAAAPPATPPRAPGAQAAPAARPRSPSEARAQSGAKGSGRRSAPASSSTRPPDPAGPPGGAGGSPASADPVWRVDVEDLRLANADFAGRFKARYWTEAAGPGRLELDGNLDRARAVRVARYLPVQIHHEVRDWVADAVRGGQSGDVRVKLRGRLHEFPFHERGQVGEFSIVARLDQGLLAFEKDWPALERISAILDFSGNGMDIRADSARIGGLAVKDVRARIADFHEGRLEITGASRSPVPDLLAFVKATPVARFTDHHLDPAGGTGDVQVDLSLGLPLHDLHASEVRTRLRFSGNSLRLSPGSPELSGIEGDLQVSEHGVQSEGISARFLGGPVTATVLNPQPGRTQVQASGRLDAAALSGLTDSPLLGQISGQTAYRLDFDSRGGGGATPGPRLQLSSDLVGLTSRLPAPFAKAAGEPWPLRLVSRPTSADAVETSISLREDLKILIGRERGQPEGPLLITRAAFAMNAEPALPERGLSVTLKLPRVDFDAWEAQLVAHRDGSAAGHDGAAPMPALGGDFAPDFSLIPTHVAVLTPELTLSGKQLHDVVFGATRQGETWQANVASREIGGYFSWRDAPPGQKVGKLTARFTRLEIPPSRQHDIESIADADQGDLPSLDLIADELVLGGRSLGRLALSATHSVRQGSPLWVLDELRLEQPAGTLIAHGTWAAARSGAGRLTVLDFGLDVRDAGRLLNDFGIKDAIRGAPGRLDGQLRWAGSPMSIDYPTLSGHLNATLGKGQFLKTEPGLAKLISVLSLQALPKRLSFDFSDVFAAGFAFDSIQGKAMIRNGVVHADELAMDGPQARVRLSGEVDVVHERQQLEVVVRPIVNAGLASLAYAAVNPAVGLGTFLAQMLLSKPLEEIFTHEYRISGTWTDPEVVEKTTPPPRARAEP